MDRGTFRKTDPDRCGQMDLSGGSTVPSDQAVIRDLYVLEILPK